jgi:hypothetical protein
MKFYVVNLLAILSVSFGVNAQTYWVNKTQLLNFLYQRNESVIFISTSSLDQQVLPLYYGKQPNMLHKIIRNKNGLYVLVDGTGQIFKATNSTNNQIAFTRIDSTIHFGYNHHSIDLSWHDTIYSLGGYGFWHVNGQLRYFNDGADWIGLKLNQELPIIERLNYFDNKDGSIYQIHFRHKNEIAEAKHDEVKFVSRISIKDKEHIMLGELDNYFSSEMPDQRIDYWISENLKGSIAIIKSEAYLFDFINNKAYKSKTFNLHKPLIGNITANKAIYIFQINDTVYFTRSKSDSLYSFTVSRSDFSEEGIPIYIPLNQNFNNILIGSGLFAGMLSFIGFRQYRKKYTTKTSKTIFGKPVHESDPLLFTEVEKNLIQLMINQQTLNVDEVNNLLGLAKKTLEIQKKIRTETLNKINHKFRVLSEEESEFIERIRSEQDRRFYNYTISKENIDIYWKLIK